MSDNKKSETAKPSHANPTGGSMTNTRKSPSRLKSYVRTLDDGYKLVAEVSPCVLAYDGYPLQLSVTLRGPSGESLGDCYPTDRSKTAKSFTVADVRRLLQSVRVIPCPRCSAPAFDPATADTNRAGLCETCFLTELHAELAEAEEAEKQELAAQDAREKAAGMTVRITAWIHPKAGGDDYLVDWYFAEEPTPSKIRSLLREEGSMEFDDFTVVTL